MTIYYFTIFTNFYGQGLQLGLKIANWQAITLT